MRKKGNVSYTIGLSVSSFATTSSVSVVSPAVAAVCNRKPSLHATNHRLKAL